MIREYFFGFVAVTTVVHAQPYLTVVYKSFVKLRDPTVPVLWNGGVLYRSVAYHTVAYRTVAYRTIVYRNVAYRTVAYRTIAYRTVAYRNLVSHRSPERRVAELFLTTFFARYPLKSTL